MVPQSYASNTGAPHRPRRSEPIFPELPELLLRLVPMLELVLLRGLPSAHLGKELQHA